MKQTSQTGKQALGFLIVIASAVMWGSTGVAGEYLINQRGLSSAWLTTYRTTFGGLLMVLFLAFRMKRRVFIVWKNKKDARQMILFGLFGVGFNLYFYMLAVQHTNAPTATTLQYLSPAMIVLFSAAREKKMPTRKEILGVILALSGVFLISTHGNPRTLTITETGLLIGISSAVTLSFYNIYPRRLLAAYGSVYTFAWGQLVAGILMNIIRCPIWRFTPPANGIMDLPLILVLAYQLFFGTMISYCIYLTGVTLIGPSKASMLSSIEPVATAILAAAVLSTPLVFMDYIGILLITACVLILAVPSRADR